MKQRDITDNYLRRSARALGFKGKYLPLSIADYLTHSARPGESVLLHEPDETRREAAARLRNWAASSPEGSRNR